jgi:lipid A oxidase
MRGQHSTIRTTCSIVLERSGEIDVWRPTVTKSLLGTAFAVLNLLAAPVAAETDLAFYLGGQSLPHSVVTGSDPGNDPDLDFTAAWEGRSFEAPVYYGLRVTQWRSDTIGWGAEFTHSKAYSDDDTRADQGFDRLELTDGVNIFTINAYRRWPNQMGALTPYVGGGLGFAVPHVEVESDGGSTIGYQVTGAAMRWTAGATYSINKTWGVFGEYQGTFSQHDMQLDNGGSLETSLVTNALNIGVSFTF